ncbi:MAG: PQQ-binding-like beta-propeller repeat protein, partial [Acidimicrobiales bacterium]
MRRTFRVAAAASAGAAVLGMTGASLAATSAGAAPAPSTVHAQTAILGAPTWNVTVPDGGTGSGLSIAGSSPNVATLAGGAAVVVGDRSGHVYAYHLADGSAVAGYPFTTTGSVTSTPAAAGGPATGRDTILVGSGNVANAAAGRYYGISPTGAHNWSHQETNPGGSHSGVQASMAVGSLQGAADTVAGSMGQNEDAFTSISGGQLTGFTGNPSVSPPDPDGWFQADTDLSTPAIADVAGNGQNQIVEGGASSSGLAYGRQYNAGGHILVLSPTGNAGTGNPAGGLVCEYTTTEEVDSSPAVGKFLGGTAVGIVAGTGSFYPGASQENQVIALNSGCGFAWSASLAGTTSSSPALADVLGNGHLQVVEAARTGTVYALNGANGATLWRTNVGHQIFGSPATADLTGSGHQDVVVATVNGLAILTGASGSVLQDTVMTTTGFQNAPLITDTAGAIGITVAGYSTTASHIYHWRITGSNGAAVTEAGAWPEFHHDPQLSGNAGTPPPVVQVTCKGQAPSHPSGYYLSAADGGIFRYGNLPFCGSTGNIHLNQPVVGITAPPAANGYWEVASDGGLFAFGTVAFHGSMGGKPLNKPVVGMAADPATGGYWEVASDGGLFAFTAPFYGSMGGKPLNAPIVGMAATKTGHGYWLVASDGGLFAYGNAAFHGSMGGKPLNQPIVGMAANPTGGYWLVASDGGLFAYDAPFLGSMGGKPLNKPVVGMTATSTGGGYWEVASDGGL